jgi:SOS response regulatory protein OraA/RecX
MRSLIPTTKRRSDARIMDRLNEAVEVSLRFMRSRERFPGEVHTALIAKGFAEEDATAAVAYLVKRGLLSESRAAEEALRRMSGKRAVGNARLAQEWETLGAITPLPNLDERERASAAIAARHVQRATPGQASRFLAARGFSEETIRSVLEELFPEAFG